MIHSKWSAQARKSGEDRAIRLYLDLWLYAIYAEGRPIVELLARWHLLRHKNNTIWLGFLAIELMYWARGTWQLGNRQMPSASACHFFVGIFFLCFSHSLNSLTCFWKCQNELKLLNYFLYTHIWQRASRESFHLPPSGGFRQTVLVSVNGFGEENTLADHRRSISPWMKSIEIGAFSLGLCNE